MGIKMHHGSHNTCIFFSKIETNLFLMNNENGKEAICFIFFEMTVNRHEHLYNKICVYIYIYHCIS